MLVHELRAVISPRTSEVKLKLGLISNDENRPMYSETFWANGLLSFAMPKRDLLPRGLHPSHRRCGV